MSLKLNSIAAALASLSLLTACSVNNDPPAGVTPPAPGAGLVADINMVLLGAGNKLQIGVPATPRAVYRRADITGLAAGETILAIDYRPAPQGTPAVKLLYGVSSLSNLYTINITTGAATLVAPLTIPLDAAAVTSLGVDIDWNPAADRLRIVTDTDQNLRFNPNDNVTTLDTALNPTADITAAAYTNNFSGTPTGITTLYVIDATTNSLLLQGGPDSTPSPNGGTLTNVGAVGALGVNVPANLGFDIDGFLGVGYLAFRNGTVAELHTVNLATGVATRVDQLGDGTFAVADIAIEPPAPPTMVGVTTANQLVSFPISGATLALTDIGTGPITVDHDRNTATVPQALAAGENILGLDFRPSLGTLFALSSTGCLYAVSTSGTTAGVATPFDLDTATTGVQCAITPALAGAEFGFDFNPLVDRIRVIGDTQQNLRLNPGTGGVVDSDTMTAGIQGDTNLSSAGITAAAYTNSFTRSLDFAAPTVTTIFVLETTSANDMLALQGSENGTPNSPNGGLITNIGVLGADFTDDSAFDIIGGNTKITTPTTTWVNAVGFAVLTPTASPTQSSLFRINLATGAAISIAPVGATATVIRAATLDIKR